MDDLRTDGMLRTYASTEHAMAATEAERKHFHELLATAQAYDENWLPIVPADLREPEGSPLTAAASQSPLTPIPLRTPSPEQSEALAAGLEQKANFLRKGNGSRSAGGAAKRLQDRLRAANRERRT